MMCSVAGLGAAGLLALALVGCAPPPPEADAEPRAALASRVSGSKSGTVQKDDESPTDVVVVGSIEGDCVSSVAAGAPPGSEIRACSSACAPTDAFCQASCFRADAWGAGCARCRRLLGECAAANCASCEGDPGGAACTECVSTACTADWTACAGALRPIARLPVSVSIPGADECVSDSDRSRLIDRSTPALIADCAQSCGGSSGLSCLTTCLEDAGLSQECSGCVSELVECVPGRCFDRCADPLSSDCRTCAGSDCAGAFIECGGVDPSDSWHAPVLTSYVRLASLDPDRALSQLVAGPEGTPVARTRGYPSGSVYGRVVSDTTELAVTAGAAGPSAERLAVAEVSLVPAARYIAVLLRGEDSEGEALRVFEEPVAAASLTRFRVISGYGVEAGTVLVSDVTETPVAVGEIGFGEATTWFPVPPGPAVVEIDDGTAAWQVSIVLPRGVDTTILFGVENDGAVQALVVQDTESVFAVSAVAAP